MRISDWSSDVCSSELTRARGLQSNGKAPQVRVQLPDGTVYEHPGVLDFSGDIVDPDTGSVPLRAQLPHPDKRLMPGPFVAFDFSLGQLPNARTKKRRVGKGGVGTREFRWEP